MLKYKSKNIELMYLFRVISGMLFFLPIIALYFEESLFNVTNVAIIFAIQAITLAFLEVPTGAIADLFGRKKTLILSQVFALIALTCLYIGGNMLMFSLYSIFFALGLSLSSGTDNAIIYDTLKNEKKENEYKKVIGTYYAMWPFGAMIGSLIGGYLATFSLSLPVLFTFIPTSVALMLTFLLQEPKYKKEDHKNVVKQIFDSSKIIIKDYHLVLIFVAGFIVWGLGESMHRLNSLFFTFKEIPLMYFGIISAFLFGFSSLGHYFSHHFSEKFGNKNALIIATICQPLVLLIATFSTKYTAAIFWAIGSLFFGLRNPIVNHLINLEVKSSKRATVMSAYNFMDGLGTAVVAPFVGYLAELYTINTAFKISAILLFSAPILYFFIKDKN